MQESAYLNSSTSHGKSGNLKMSDIQEMHDGVTQPDIAPMEVAGISVKRKAEFPDETWIASSSKRQHLSPGNETPEEPTIKLEDLFPEAFIPLSEVLQGMSVRSPPPFFTHLMSLVQASKAQQLGHLAMLDAPSVNDLLAMNNEAWTDFLSYPALLASVTAPPPATSTVGKYVSLLSGLRQVLSEASNMTVELSIDALKEESLNSELSLSRETIARQEQVIKNQEALLQEIQRRSIYAAFKETRTEDVAKIKEIRIMISKEFMRSTVAHDCYSLLSQHFFESILQNFKRQVCMHFPVSNTDQRWSDVNPWVWDNGIAIPNKQLFGLGCEDIRSELMEYARELSSYYPSLD